MWADGSHGISGRVVRSLRRNDFAPLRGTRDRAYFTPVTHAASAARRTCDFALVGAGRRSARACASLASRRGGARAAGDRRAAPARARRSGSRGELVEPARTPLATLSSAGADLLLLVACPTRALADVAASSREPAAGARSRCTSPGALGAGVARAAAPLAGCGDRRLPSPARLPGGRGRAASRPRASSSPSTARPRRSALGRRLAAALGGGAAVVTRGSAPALPPRGHAARRRRHDRRGDGDRDRDAPRDCRPKPTPATPRSPPTRSPQALAAPRSRRGHHRPGGARRSRHLSRRSSRLSRDSAPEALPVVARPGARDACASAPADRARIRPRAGACARARSPPDLLDLAEVRVLTSESGTVTAERHGLLQLQHDADGGQGRVLRPGSVRQDDQPPVHLRPHLAGQPRRDGLARDRDRPHPLLRPPADRRRLDRRLQHPHPALHRSRPGLLQHHAQAGAQGRRRRRLRRRLAAPDAAGQRRLAAATSKRTWQRWASRSTPCRSCCSTTSATCRTSARSRRWKQALNRAAGRASRPRRSPARECSRPSRGSRS